jgi:hypothetical protein
VDVIQATLVSPVEETGKENVLPGAGRDGAGIAGGKEDAPASERFRQREGEMKAEWVTRFWEALDSIDKYPPPSKPPSQLTGYLYRIRVDQLSKNLLLAKKVPPHHPPNRPIHNRKTRHKIPPLLPHNNPPRPPQPIPLRTPPRPPHPRNLARRNLRRRRPWKSPSLAIGTGSSGACPCEASVFGGGCDGA